MSRIYFSPSERGFFHEADFGARTLTHVDPEWQRPTITVTLKPGESYDMGPHHPPLVNDEADAITITDVPDLSVKPPMVTVPNPDCRIPADAVEVTREEHQTLLAGQSSEKMIHVVNGKAVLVDAPPPSNEEAARRAREQRDHLLADSDWVRLRALDTGEDVPQAWQAYRQALRDITKQSGFPQNINWPEKPAE